MNEGAMTEKTDSLAWNFLFLGWLTALVSSLTVLYVGEILGQTPCILCWYQRIFMFPLAIILGLAVFSSDFSASRYVLPLALGGGLVAGWHSLLYAGIIPEEVQPCTADGPSCSGADMTILGGIPLPLLALIAFGAIFILTCIAKKRSSA